MESRKIFSNFENELLIELVGKFKNVIENKETNKVSSIKKAEAFEEIAKVYNQNLNVCSRSAKQLRQRYQNLKKKAAKGSALIRREIRMTGGGEPVKKIADLEEKNLGMGIKTQPLQTIYDSDGSYMDYVLSAEANDSTVNDSPTEVAKETESTTSQESNDGPFVFMAEPSLLTPKPEISKTPGRQALELFKKKSRKQRPTISATSKAAEMMVLESRQKMDNENVEHQLRMRLLKKDLELKEKQIAVREKILLILDSNPTAALKFT